MSKVVNVKVKYIRPKYNNLKDWCKDKDNYYIGRKCIVIIDGQRYPPKDSIFANPYKIDKDGDRDEVLEKYKIYIKSKIENNPEILNEIKNKTLGCWCKPDKCHGDILIDILKNF